MAPNALFMEVEPVKNKSKIKVEFKTCFGVLDVVHDWGGFMLLREIRGHIYPINGIKDVIVDHFHLSSFPHNLIHFLKIKII